MFAPESVCAPVALPFSMTATGTSPSCSASSGSFSSSCISRFAHASPAGPPPTMATPTSRRSSSGSVGGPTNSSTGSTGGGNSAGAIPAMYWALGALLALDGLGQLREDLVEITDHTEVRVLEDRRVRVLVDREDVLRVLHPDLVLDRPGDAGAQVQLRSNRLAGLPDLGGVGDPAGVDDRAGRGDLTAEGGGQIPCDGEVVLASEAAAGADQDVGVGDVDAALIARLAAGDHPRLVGPLGQLHLDVSHLGVARAVLLRVE